ncbi:hypothetical protein QQ045_033555 [Rhodiola kirilowii]
MDYEVLTEDYVDAEIAAGGGVDDDGVVGGEDGGVEGEEEVAIRTGGGKKRKNNSPAWEHCLKRETTNSEGETEVTGICKYCNFEMPAHSKKNGTRGLLNHLKKCVVCPLYEGSRAKSTQPSLINVTMGGGGALVPHVFNQKKCELLMVEFVIRDEQPFRAVEGAGFVNFLHGLQPRFKIPDRKKVARGVWELYMFEKGKIKSVICDKRVSITTNTWTSIQNINYMVITAHFVDDSWNLHKRIINFTKITSHKGEDIGLCLERCLREWGVEKVFSITVDNASANEGAVAHMKRKLERQGNLVLSGEYLHLRCACHILNLIVKDGLGELEKAIEGIRNCVKYIHSSLARLDAFINVAILENMDSMSNIPMDVPTRWNSTYKMLEGAFKYKGVFSRMDDEDVNFRAYFNEEVKKDGVLVKRMGPPMEEAWLDAQAFTLFLKRFYDSTIKLSASKTPTSNLIFNEMVALQQLIEKKMRDWSNPILRKVAQSMKIKFDKYWGQSNGGGNGHKINLIVFIANVLDPRFKLSMLDMTLSSLGQSRAEVEGVISMVKASLQDLHKAYKGGVPDTTQPSSSVAIIDDDDDDCANDLLRQLDRQRHAMQTDEITNDLDSYFADAPEAALNKEFKLMEWWMVNQFKYPIVSKIAKDIFAIPSSTVASEAAFSLGKRVVDPFRASLTPLMVEALVCTSDWLRAEEFDFFKEPTDEEFEMYKELEEIETNVQLSQLPTFPPTPSSVASTSSMSSSSMNLTSSASLPPLPPPRSSTMDPSTSTSTRGRGRGRGRGASQ